VINTLPTVNISRKMRVRVAMSLDSFVRRLAPIRY